MRRRGHDSTQATVSLFPFLAVLICTMGVLLMLLVIASHAADENERTKAAQLSVADDEELANLKLAQESSELKTHAILAARDKTRSELDQAAHAARNRRARLIGIEVSL